MATRGKRASERSEGASRPALSPPPFLRSSSACPSSRIGVSGLQQLGVHPDALDGLRPRGSVDRFPVVGATWPARPVTASRMSACRAACCQRGAALRRVQGSGGQTSHSPPRQKMYQVEVDVAARAAGGPGLVTATVCSWCLFGGRSLAAQSPRASRGLTAGGAGASAEADVRQQSRSRLGVDGGPGSLAPPPGRWVSAKCARAGAVRSELLTFGHLRSPNDHGRISKISVFAGVHNKRESSNWTISPNWS